MYPIFQEEKRIGKMVMLDTKNPAANPIELKLTNLPSEFKFTPMGLDILERSDGSVLVYVANHGSEDNFDGNKSVLKFLFNQEDAELLLLSSFVHDLHISINDLTVISEDEYYFTNDSAFNHNQGSWRMLEMMIPLNLGSIGYCKNGNNCKLVTSQNLAFPNGITWKKIDGRMKIYVTLYKGTEILIYKPDSKMNLQLFSSIELPYGFDNINKMNDGRLFVNGHSFEWTGFDLADFHPMAAPFHKLVTDSFAINDDYTLTQVYFSRKQDPLMLSSLVQTENFVLFGSPFHDMKICRK